MREVVFLVAGESCNGEALHIDNAALTVLIEHIVDGAGIVALEYAEILNVLAHIELVGNAYELVFSVFVEDDDVVDIGAVAHKLVLLKPHTDEALLTVDVELLIGLGNGGSHDVVEVANDGAAREVRAIFSLDALIPLDCKFHEVSELVVDVGNALVEGGDVVVGSIAVEADNALHLDFHEAENVVAGDFAVERGLERL